MTNPDPATLGLEKPQRTQRTQRKRGEGLYSLLLAVLLGLVPGCSWYYLDRDPNERLVGEKAPDFTLPAAFGEEMSLASLRARGDVVLVFYRGHW